MDKAEIEAWDEFMTAVLPALLTAATKNQEKLPIERVVAAAAVTADLAVAERRKRLK